VHGNVGCAQLSAVMRTLRHNTSHMHHVHAALLCPVNSTATTQVTCITCMLLCCSLFTLQTYIISIRPCDVSLIPHELMVCLVGKKQHWPVLLCCVIGLLKPAVQTATKQSEAAQLTIAANLSPSEGVCCSCRLCHSCRSA